MTHFCQIFSLCLIKESLFLIQKLYVNLVCCSNVVFWQEAELSPRDRAMRRVSKYYAKCRKNIHRIACERSALCEWSSRFFKVIGMACSNMCLSCVYFFDTATFMVYVTDCRAPTLEKSFIFEKQLRLRTIDTFPFMYTHSVVNKCHKVTFRVTQGYRYWCHSIGHLWFPNSAPL